MNGEKPLTPEQIVQLVEQRNMAWVDQFNNALIHTVQAFQRLHTALDEKFTRP